MSVSSFSIIVLSSIVLSLSSFQTQAQLLEEEIPNGLRPFLKTGLDTWESPKEIAENFPYYLSGFDDENRPIWVLEFGKWDVPRMLARGPKWEEALDKHVNKWMYKMMETLGMRSDPLEPNKEAIVIIDMDGYNLKQINSIKAIAFVIRKMKLVTLTLRFAHKAMCINANFFGMSLLNMLRPIMGPDFEKLDIYGTNPAKWKPILLKYVPRDQIPEWYGGVKKEFKPLWISG